MAKSSGEFMGVTIRSTVRKAAKLAVYEDINIRVKNHQTAPTIRPDMDLGDISEPCCMNAAKENQNEFNMLKSLTAAEVTPLPPSKMLPPLAEEVDEGPTFVELGLELPAMGAETPPMMPGGCWLDIGSFGEWESEKEKQVIKII